MSSASVITADRLLTLREPGFRHELVRGELRCMSAAGRWHSAVAMRIGSRLDQFVERHDLGVVLAAEAGFPLERSPDTVLAPDVSFVQKSRVQDIAGDDFFVGPPDLAVEVVSPGDSGRAVHAKARSWLRHGARMVWTVDPKARTVVVWTPGRATGPHAANDVLSGGDVLSGFSIRVADLFPNLPGA